MGATVREFYILTMTFGTNFLVKRIREAIVQDNVFLILDILLRRRKRLLIISVLVSPGIREIGSRSDKTRIAMFADLFRNFRAGREIQPVNTFGEDSATRRSSAVGCDYF